MLRGIGTWEGLQLRFLSARPKMEPKKWYIKESRERFQAWHCLTGCHATSLPQLEPWVSPGRLGPPHL